MLANNLVKQHTKKGLVQIPFQTGFHVIQWSNTPWYVS